MGPCYPMLRWRRTHAPPTNARLPLPQSQLSTHRHCGSPLSTRPRRAAVKVDASRRGRQPTAERILRQSVAHAQCPSQVSSASDTSRHRTTQGTSPPRSFDTYFVYCCQPSSRQRSVKTYRTWSLISSNRLSRLFNSVSTWCQRKLDRAWPWRGCLLVVGLAHRLQVRRLSARLGPVALV